MDLILIFVVLPLATIIFSIALQRLLKCPILVAAVVFAIFLILTYTILGTDFIIFAIIYAILAFITAFLVNFFCKILRRLRGLEERNSDCDCNRDNDNDNLLTISSRCGNGNNTELLTISTGGTYGNNNNSNNWECNNNSCNCGCNNSNNTSNESIVVNAEVVPFNNGTSGAFRGGFRRRRCN